jgi:transposase-like protein
VVGRQSGRLLLDVVETVDRQTLQGFVERTTAADATVYTDELGAYGRLDQTGRGHATGCHTPGQREWARDDDGDGVREVHVNTLEGIWTGLRNFLRPFRGVRKWFLDEYVGIFNRVYVVKAVTPDFIRALCGLWPTTNLGP